MTVNHIKSKESMSGLGKWFKRVGIAGFLFFLLKGIAWLFVFFWAGKCALD